MTRTCTSVMSNNSRPTRTWACFCGARGVAGCTWTRATGSPSPATSRPAPRRVGSASHSDGGMTGRTRPEATGAACWPEDRRRSRRPHCTGPARRRSARRHTRCRSRTRWEARTPEGWPRRRLRRRRRAARPDARTPVARGGARTPILALPPTDRCRAFRAGEVVLRLVPVEHAHREIVTLPRRRGAWALQDRDLPSPRDRPTLSLGSTTHALPSRVGIAAPTSGMSVRSRPSPRGSRLATVRG